MPHAQVLTASLGTSSVGSQCTSAVQSAVQTVQELTASTSGLAQLAQLFTLCAGSQPSSALDIAQFMLVVVGAFMVGLHRLHSTLVVWRLAREHVERRYLRLLFVHRVPCLQRVVQYNNEEGYNIDEVCTMMLNASSPLQGFADVSYLVNVEGYNVQCMETSYSNLIYYLQLDTLTAPYTVSGTRQWTYLLCSYVDPCNPACLRCSMGAILDGTLSLGLVLCVVPLLLVSQRVGLLLHHGRPQPDLRQPGGPGLVCAGVHRRVWAQLQRRIHPGKRERDQRVLRWC